MHLKSSFMGAELLNLQHFILQWMDYLVPRPSHFPPIVTYLVLGNEKAGRYSSVSIRSGVLMSVNFQNEGLLMAVGVHLSSFSIKRGAIRRGYECQETLIGKGC